MFRRTIPFVFFLAGLQAQPVATFEIAGDWEVRVTDRRAGSRTISVPPSTLVEVLGERYERVPVFNPKAGGWIRGAQLKGVRAQETTSPKLLDPSNFVLRTGPEESSPVLRRGTDYEVDLEWGTFGRLEGGGIREGQPVYATYRHARMRLDAVVVTKAGEIRLRPGEPRAAAPQLARLEPGDRHLGNIYLSGFTGKLSEDCLFPILERSYPETKIPKSATVERVIRKLKKGGPLRILAWGDSVTDGAYITDKTTGRWQEQFVARLRQRYPKARIELTTEAWGGRNTGSYLNEPPGSVHNYREKVLGAKPDLVISEFVNDARLGPEEVEARYSRLLQDFRSIGAEWVILTPHYVRPDWMGLSKEREVDSDPRPYVRGLREFASRHDVGLADASLRYGRLWRQGIPYNALMVNSINHPDERGMRLFADALMALFR